MKKIVVLVFVMFLTTAVASADYTYNKTRKIGGSELSLVGQGTRTKWFFDVYELGVYTTTKMKDAKQLISTNELKQLNLHMLREIGNEKMTSAIDEGFNNNVSEADRKKLAEKIAAFKAYFKEPLKEDLDIVMTYDPKTGTTTIIGDKTAGTIAGDDFMKALWGIWFGKEPADSGLKDDIVEAMQKEEEKKS